MNEGWNVVARHDEAFGGLNIWFIKQNADGSRVTVQPVNLALVTDMEPGSISPEPTIQIGGFQEAQQFLQGLAGAIIEAGYIPDELKAKDKEIEAVKAHLEDMRKLVFDALLPPELPPPQLR